MTKSVKHKLLTVTVVYWVLLVYMVVALVWWFVALQKQNTLMSQMRLQELKQSDPHYSLKVAEINTSHDRKVAQYIGEGSTFLALILLGAVFVFRATRRQIRVSHQQHNFMMAVTHELKTPIAVAQLNLETLQKRKLDETKQQRLISNTLQEANRLNILCNNILLAAQLDAGAYKANQNEINWSETVADCAKNFTIRYPERKITTEISDGIYVLGEELLLEMIVNNLIENALKYSPATSPLTIALYEHNNKAILEVKDEGAGVADADKKQVFEKFYRSGDENTRNTKGTGLGLYLCKKIVEEHRGRITITDNMPKGSIFTVTLNLNNDTK